MAKSIYELEKFFSISEKEISTIKNLYISYEFFNNINTIFNSVDHEEVTNIFMKFCNSLVRCQNLEYLNLNSNKLIKLDIAAFNALGHALSKCNKIEELNISYNELGKLMPDIFQVFCNTLANCKSLKTLKLNNNNLCSLDKNRFESLFKAIATLENLETLDLSNNNIFDSGIGFSYTGKSIPINLISAPLPVDLSCIELLSNTLANYKNLKRLDFSKNNLNLLDNVSFETLFKSIAKCVNLEHIDLSNNQLGSINKERYEILHNTLLKCKNLKTLCLENNNFSTEQLLVLQEKVAEKNGAFHMANFLLFNRFKIPFSKVNHELTAPWSIILNLPCEIAIKCIAYAVGCHSRNIKNTEIRNEYNKLMPKFAIISYREKRTNQSLLLAYENYKSQVTNSFESHESRLVLRAFKDYNAMQKRIDDGYGPMAIAKPCLRF